MRLMVLVALAVVASVIDPRAVLTERVSSHSAHEAATIEDGVVVPMVRQVGVVPPVQDAAASLDPAPVASPDGFRIAVPRLGIDLPLDVGDIGRDVPRSDYSGATPEAVALVFPGSSVPGLAGNSYIYAHARRGMFLALWGVRLDDIVVVARADRSVLREYRVVLVVPRVDPGDTHWLDSGGRERLTLQTSTGPRPEDPRFIAVAYPVEQWGSSETDP